MNVSLSILIADLDAAIIAANLACFVSGIAVGVSLQTWRCGRDRRGKS